MKDFQNGCAARISAIQSHLKVTIVSEPSLDVNSRLNIFLLRDFYLGRKFVDSLFVLSATVATGAPNPPLPADVGSRETKGGACKNLAAAAGIRTGWICYFLLVDLRDHWYKKERMEANTNTWNWPKSRWNISCSLDLTHVSLCPLSDMSISCKKKLLD